MKAYICSYDKKCKSFVKLLWKYLYKLVFKWYNLDIIVKGGEVMKQEVLKKLEIVILFNTSFEPFRTE